MCRGNQHREEEEEDEEVGGGGLGEGRACAKSRIGEGESTNRIAKEAMNFVCSPKGGGVEKKLTPEERFPLKNSKRHRLLDYI